MIRFLLMRFFVCLCYAFYIFIVPIDRKNLKYTPLGLAFVNTIIELFGARYTSMMFADILLGDRSTFHSVGIHLTFVVVLAVAVTKIFHFILFE